MLLVSPPGVETPAHLFTASACVHQVTVAIISFTCSTAHMFQSIEDIGRKDS